MMALSREPRDGKGAMRYFRRGLVGVVIAAALSLPTNAGFAASFTVDSIGDGADSSTIDGVCDDGTGKCTLRAAIMQANATAGADVIAFNIPPGGPRTIQPLTALPAISEPVTIDGSTQPGFAGMPIIELDGTNTLGNAVGLWITAGGSTIRGLVINSFIPPTFTGICPAGILIQQNGGNLVEDNFLGTDLAGTTRRPNCVGVAIDNTPNNTIGGTGANARNVISGNGTSNQVSGVGVAVLGPAAIDNKVQANYIGTDRTGGTALGNLSAGVAIDGASRTIVGGTVDGGRNVISGNGSGVDMRPDLSSGAIPRENVLQGNFIGTEATGTRDLGNGRGVEIQGDDNVIGGPTAQERNIISGNDDNGIQIGGGPGSAGRRNLVKGNFIGVDLNGAPLGNSNGGAEILFTNDNTLTGNVIAYNASLPGSGAGGVNVDCGTGNAIRSNSIFSNVGLGIELAAGTDCARDGVTPNDPLDLDSGSNNLQNYPVLTSANSSGGGSTISGTLNSSPSASFAIDFFASGQCDASLNGEGQRFLGSTSVTTDAAGNASFTASLPGVSLDTDNDGVNETVTSTATDAGGNSSEFSRCFGSGDNCPTVANPEQADANTNGIGDACDPGDTDNDGFSDRVEYHVGTSRLLSCGTDAWPPDINNDGHVDIIGDISQVAGQFGNRVPPAPARYDIAPDPPDALIDVIGDISRLAGLFAQSCTP